jgi:ATP/maltotriose-dependent transcriptional regulator MalT
MELIVDKLTAAQNTSALSRSRLSALLEESMATCSATIVNGRAGLGKTTLISDFASRCGRATAWYKVDAPDGDSSVFFSYLIAAIRQHRPHFGGNELESLLATTDESDFSLFAEAFVYELLKSEPEPLLIVIEDLHLVYDAPWLVSFFGRLLPLLPADVHMVITSRTLPPAPLWRMRSKQNLTVVDEPELAFTRQEAISLFEMHGLSREQATIALDHTHGRAQALAACAESMQMEMEQEQQRTSRHVTAGI